MLMQALATITTTLADGDLQRLRECSEEPGLRLVAPARNRVAKTDRIGRYEIGDVIGCGGFSVVYEGYDPLFRRRVAIKVCSRCNAGSHERFRREAEVGGLLSHRNITTIFDFGVENHVPYLVEEHLNGQDLAEAIRLGEIDDLGDKLDVLVQIAGGLAHAHRLGVVHRDVKPSNIRLLENGTVKIMDFGSAKHRRFTGELTEIGMIVGTVAYLAPECLAGKPATARSDVFSFGVLAYELLTSRRPFDGRNIPLLIDQVVNASPRPLTEAWRKCPSDLAAIIHRCLQKAPEDRCCSLEILETLGSRLSSSGGAVGLLASD